MPTLQEDYITPYIYYIIIGADNEKTKNHINIYFNGKEKLIPGTIAKFESIKKLTIQEVAEVFKGTKGIIEYSGDFKN